MGYRGQHNREDAERARYKAEVPWHWRAWETVRASAIVLGPVATGLAIGWWLKTR